MQAVTTVFLAGYFFDLLQQLSFPLSDDPKLPWVSAPGIGTISSSLSYVTRLISSDENPAIFLAILIICSVWVGSYLSLAYSVASKFSSELPQSEISIRMLRIITSMSVGPLYIPITSVLLQGIACNNGVWLNTSLVCGGAGHVFIAFVLALTLLGFSLLAIFASLIWVDRSPSTLSWGARSHGRFDAIMIFVKLLLGFSYSVLYKQLVGSVFMTVLIMAIGAG